LHFFHIKIESDGEIVMGVVIFYKSIVEKQIEIGVGPIVE
jgi:hypothetical protein